MNINVDFTIRRCKQRGTLLYVNINKVKVATIYIMSTELILFVSVGSNQLAVRRSVCLAIFYIVRCLIREIA